MIFPRISMGQADP